MTVRGRLRVLLGAAPGVGKTYAMLEEGRRLADAGTDVVIGIVETHGRAATAAMTAGLPELPRRAVGHRGVELDELDLAGLLARRPALALVDELAHTNAPGSRNEKRWQDVAELLEAGIDVYSTLNVQHIASVNDVVEQITGVPQRETVPDAFLRGADQIEVIDLAPQALRDRLAGGVVYPAERIDAALSNYFRLGNLTALRELALLWLADEVDQALTSYRSEHGIQRTWEARERVVVALTGGPEGETLLRRGARIAARAAGGALVAVHVTSPDGLRSGSPAALAQQRALAEQLGGSYHQVLGSDVPDALVDFARSHNATQLVLGASRRGRIATALTGPGIGATVIRESGDIDVHIVTHAAAGSSRSLPRLGGGLTARRRLAGLGIALVGGPLLTWLLYALRSPESITGDVLSYQLLVVLVALVGGLWPALFAAVLSGITLDYLFIAPLFTVTITDPLHVVALLLYMTIAALVSFVVDRAARTARAARRAAAESELIQTVAGSVLRGDSAVQALVDRVREAFSLAGARLVEDGATIAAAGSCDAEAAQRLPVGERAELELYGAHLPASEQRLLAVITAQLDAALQHQHLAETASEIAPIAASDRVRGALLSALSHDLRRPLAAATTAVGGLRTAGAALSQDDRRALLETADESLSALTALVTDLLDVSRLQAGALAIATAPLDPADAVGPALDELALGPAEVSLALAHGERQAVADPVLLQRVLVNLLANARRFSPPERTVLIATSTFADRVELRVVDHGPGIPPDRRDEVFVPFQRLGDTANGTGLGLGLALSKGFVEAMGGTLEPEDTPGGGLTMVVSLPAAPAPGPVPPGSAASRRPSPSTPTAEEARP
ncbi:sensor histidine kinase [Leucobacter luti]|uniref:histidine kinase n=1 Tax=Leucobacter luti TaxID=340320 RepID=A0A4Q7U430_9MICO|nr:ATP-binding protein [Leucobacter luti]MBL3699576.1 sensor histidine kinase KdpD [Leucobacter luti]RZT67088.1 two-component system sensor histidine kinase KdpD [Leucobacter luti]